MKNYSYLYLFSVTALALGGVFLFFWWRADIDRATFLDPLTFRYIVLGSMGGAFIISLFLVSKGIIKDGRIDNYLKLFAGVSILVFALVLMPLITIVYFLPGEPSSYTAPYVYVSGGSRSCSGAEVYDPDLQKNIRICYPYGDYENGNIIYIEKRSNILGAVVTYAMTSRQDSD
ncbi:hypothetical protein CQT46_11625 [Salmonella enterica]|uniref:hypothetical protein n=1 Tax=Salmonella enterica TaxID=28901 RepID=UPI0012870600|nr:hypothetical protein [Salmonella enterica]EBU6739433.1 hypothetical protein [Salmonella enterica subsp. enterica serovar Adelaide]ECH8734019.1 hypothetical protein [Salmonella enterica subsp. enterica serovar Wandsworth]EDV5349936.1 hypothetical protein [Salmonella enterica subsp. houtenae]EDW6063503.1 hypothetical protein [Salmonella enterica subsp. enterica serovar Oslo]EEC5249633.1 hypothetical protein [Salmonella enterica subsp. enterica serovar Poona]EFS0438367.1 hypothetical protein 